MPWQHKLLGELARLTYEKNEYEEVQSSILGMPLLLFKRIVLIQFKNACTCNSSSFHDLTEIDY